MEKFSKYVGLDVHKATIAVAIADSDGGDARFYGQIANSPAAVAKLLRELSKGGAKLCFCYEAGCCGFVILRQILELGQACQVIAPSLIPKKAGDRVKTDRRDSLMLARLLRAGELTEIRVPDPDQEALRDLTRMRNFIKLTQRQAKQQLLAFLLRHGVDGFTGKSNWTLAHFRWFETVKFTHPVQQLVFQEHINKIQSLAREVKLLEDYIFKMAKETALWPYIEALMALRGINQLTAVIIMAEIGDLTRFDTAPKFMSFIGLVPSEDSSGNRRKQAGITKTGNSQIRRALTEAAWTYRHHARKTATLERRAEKTSPAIQEIAWTAQKRLCGRYSALNAKGKMKVQVCTAIARELAGFVWAVGREVAATANPTSV
jgi:transposase